MSAAQWAAWREQLEALTRPASRQEWLDTERTSSSEEGNPQGSKSQGVADSKWQTLGDPSSHPGFTMRLPDFNELSFMSFTTNTSTEDDRYRASFVSHPSARELEARLTQRKCREVIAASYALEREARKLRKDPDTPTREERFVRLQRYNAKLEYYEAKEVERAERSKRLSEADATIDGTTSSNNDSLPGTTHDSGGKEHSPRRSRRSTSKLRSAIVERPSEKRTELPSALRTSPRLPGSNRKVIVQSPQFEPLPPAKNPLAPRRGP
eukprot:TRINITY_DN42494_c0_g1_i1.p1 TRINITY_DN42494_c0_g1~~TRINITY_DN42494_c0_g1_i1.p1  ORF type:complete len:267 (-),score=23.11 TRINITY_DN42494_c0_g1_i1:9-809(-)